MRLMNCSVAYTDGDALGYASVVTLGDSPTAKVTVYAWKGDPAIYKRGDRWVVLDAIDNATVASDRKGNYRITGRSKRRALDKDIFPDPTVDIVVVPGPTGCQGCS